MTYDPNSFFAYLGYPGGEQPYFAPGLSSLTVYCRGEEANLAKLLEPTPFELADTVFGIQIADFRSTDIGPYWDSGIVVPVRYGETRGATYLFEWEDQPWSIAFGREVWGYPKQSGAIDLVAEDDEVRGAVTHEGAAVFSIGARLEDGYDDSAWRGVSLYPHLQVHCLPAADRGGFSLFEIVSRDTSADFALASRRVGSGRVELGSSIAIAGTELVVGEVLGAEYVVGDYACTRENGRASVIDRLIP